MKSLHELEKLNVEVNDEFVAAIIRGGTVISYRVQPKDPVYRDLGYVLVRMPKDKYIKEQSNYGDDVLFEYVQFNYHNGKTYAGTFRNGTKRQVIKACETEYFDKQYHKRRRYDMAEHELI